MNKWTVAEVAEWVSAVHSGVHGDSRGAAYVCAAVTYIEAELAKQTSSSSQSAASSSSNGGALGKRKLPDNVPKIFGTTTMAGRSKVAHGVRAGHAASALQTAQGSVAALLSAGQLLAKANFQEVFREVREEDRAGVAALMREARARRSR